MPWKFHQVYNPGRQIQDHQKPDSYQMGLPYAEPKAKIDPASLYVHPAMLGSPLKSPLSATVQAATR